MSNLDRILKMQKEFSLKNSIEKIKKIPQHIIDSIIPDIDIIHMRKDICDSCEFLTKNHRCLKCGCMMNFKVKLKQASCPIGKWDKVKDLPQ
jgi:hypothetical protein